MIIQTQSKADEETRLGLLQEKTLRWEREDERRLSREREKRARRNFGVEWNIRRAGVTGEVVTSG
jgi:hypothetical protein